MSAQATQIIQQTPVAEFMAHTFVHPLAKEAFMSLTQAIRADSSPQVIIFTGPTGVGKSTLVRAAGKRLIQECQEQLANEPDFVPVVAINAIPPTGGHFNWKDFYIRLSLAQPHLLQAYRKALRA
jgi:DNA replication protein DnaC